MAAKKHELTKTLKFNLGENEVIIRVTMTFVRSVEKWGYLRDAYSVVIEYNDDYIVTKYHKSRFDFLNGNRDVTEEDISNALFSICQDAIAYRDYPTFSEFKDSFGGTYKTFEVCKLLYEDMISLFGSDEWIVAIGDKADENDFEIVEEDEK